MSKHFDLNIFAAERAEAILVEYEAGLLTPLLEEERQVHRRRLEKGLCSYYEMVGFQDHAIAMSIGGGYERQRHPHRPGTIRNRNHGRQLHRRHRG